MTRSRSSRLILTIRTPLAAGLLVMLTASWLGCAGMSPRSRQAKRAHVLMARDRALETVEAEKPGESERIRSAIGYAVIGSATEMPYELPPGYGFGVVHDNSSGKNVFLLAMRQGPDANVPMPTRLLVFGNQKALANFTQGARAASAKSPAALSLEAQVDVYELLESGGVGESSMSGIRYWYDGQR